MNSRIWEVAKLNAMRQGAIALTPQQFFHLPNSIKKITKMYQRSLRIPGRSAIISIRDYRVVPRVWNGSLELLSEQDFERFRIDGS